MNTPLKELIERLENRKDINSYYRSAISTIVRLAYSYLQSEKEHIQMAFNDGKISQSFKNGKTAEDYFNKTYKEKQNTVEFDKHGALEILDGGDNKGWIKIESEEDLPKEIMFCWIKDHNKEELIAGVFLNNSQEEKDYWIANAAYYQPIIKPEPPKF